MNPTPAEQAREAISQRKIVWAIEFLEQALKEDPTDEALRTEWAITRIYSGQEQEAEQILRELTSERAHFGLRLLRDHAFCLAQLEPNDVDARARYTDLAEIVGGASEEVGTRISACLIVKNEEANLDRCLRSLSGIVDEIVVVDTGSTDRTMEIARAYGAVVGQFAWCDDFSAARNFSLGLATGQWALWIDADEEIVPESREAIRRAIVRPQFGGYDLEIVNFTDDRTGGSEFRHWPTRLFRRVEGIAFTERVHEQITPSLMRLGFPWARLDGARINHYGYRPQAMEERGKIERTVAWLEREVREAPRDAFQWFNLANAYVIAKRFPEAEHAARRATSLMPPGTDFGRLTYQILVQATTEQSKFDIALLQCAEADAKGYGGILNEFERAQTNLKAGRAEDALIAIDRCLWMDWPTGMTGDRGIFTYKRLLVRGQILAVLGMYESALDMLDQALAIDPGFPPTLYSRGAVLERLNRPEEALVSLQKATENPEFQAIGLKACGRVLFTLGRFQESADACEKSWRIAPADYESWVGWVNACEATGDISQILAAYEAFAKIHEPTTEILVNWGRALDSSGEIERAVHCFTEAIRREPGFANAYFNCGDILARCGQYQDAAHLYEAGLRHEPTNADAWFVRGNALAHVGLAEAAVRSYEQALVLQPAHAGAKHNLEIVEQEFATNAA